ncbi:hypothetical protein CTAYLR_001148 [Chrysophaeum taylorii]|uniref:EGF-like domain-containing protein n=1 Tax=Chrysophaeum taylorii TaxID=2483200 RepID=A0AAD7UPP3_9STRA|nr:hypothetical protein CTAYLR_001148 [Chrysophaeum taylorii]
MPCPNLCSNHGWCDNHDRRCECFIGFAGADCSLRTCPRGPAWADHPDNILADDEAHNSAECSRRGLCDAATGECLCDDGFEGAACERKSCSKACSGNGKCLSMEYFATLKDPGEGTVYAYENVWDAAAMYGCACDDGFEGHDCSSRKCPTGDDPGTDGVTEIQAVVCTADGGTVVFGFGGEWTTAISNGATAATLEAALEALGTVNTPGEEDGISVTFSAPATTMCDEDGETTTYIEFLQNFGSLPLLQVRTRGLELASGSTAASVAVTRYQTATKEDVVCSNRGTCDTTTGTCDCSITSTCAEACFATSDGYGNEGARGDCGAAVVNIDTCPGEVECSSHGVCDETTLSCECQGGYTGGDCSLMTCPLGKSWFSRPTADDVAHQDLVECSNAGICDRDFGECECDANFEGSACQYLVCPGDGDCGGRGECLSMSLLAEASKVNGVANPRTYGATPNDALRWDWDSVRGCKCNDGYVYHDCSGLACPFGDDPLSVNQFNEVQLLNCDLDSTTTGTITFTFREETASVTAKTATISDLEEALESMDTIDDVKLYFEIAHDQRDGGTICSTAGTDLYVEFLRPTGDVPLITTDRPSIVSIGEYTKGTKEWDECSGRGLCNRDDGTCTCFSGYGSSDGQGSPGPYGDCGSPFPVIEELLETA